MSATAQIDRGVLVERTEAELARFIEGNPNSKQLFERARHTLLGGVPMPWMMRWAGGFPVFADKASGSRITDVDGHTYVDLCLGDTGSMPGHGPAPVVAAIAEQAAKGITTMLPTENAAWVGEEMSRRFLMDRWMFTLTATDANRAALRISRQITGRSKVLVFSYSYHGSVDEAFAVAAPDGTTVAREGNTGPPVDPAETTVAIEFNDLDALERALASEEIACVLAEPAMTNMGIVLPEDGYHDALRALTRAHGTVLIIDETHTFSAGPGGCTDEWGLRAGHVHDRQGDRLRRAGRRARHDPGDEREHARRPGSRLRRHRRRRRHPGRQCALDGGDPRDPLRGPDRGGVRAYDPLATRFVDGIREVVAEYGLPWNVTQLGARAEYRFDDSRRPATAPSPRRVRPRARALSSTFTHSTAGVLITPFHNMALMSPERPRPTSTATPRSSAKRCPTCSSPRHRHE